MDFSTFVNYDQSFPVNIKFAGEDVGITFNVVSMESERVVKAIRKISSERWREVYGSGDDKASPEIIVAFNDAAEREGLIAAIDSWDWGGHSFGDLGVDPECSDANKRYVIEHPNSKWIVEQLKVASGRLGNFTQPQPKGSRKKSTAK